MKINPNNGVANQAITDRKSLQVNSGGAAAKSSTVDRTTLSTALPTMKKMVVQAMQTPEVRQDRVNSLRDAVAAGSYSIDTMKIANAITSESGS